jgi:hypothetical protein
MGSAGLRIIQLLKSKLAWAAIGVTVITLLLVGGVLAVTTTVACGPANGMGVKIAHCSDAKGTAAHFPTTTAQASVPAQGYDPQPGYQPPAYTPPPTTAQPPYNPPATSYPPVVVPATGYPPSVYAASGYPPSDPFYPPASGSVPPSHPLSCSLPIYAGPPGSGGFINFPQGNFIADPRSAVTLPTASTGSPSPAPNTVPNTVPGYGPYGPYGPGYSPYAPTQSATSYGMAWDPTHSRWLPVRTEMVAPDGNHYAYPSTNSIYLVDAATNTQAEIGVGHTWTVIRVLNDRVYATIPNSPGFWVLPFSGAPRQVNPQGYWQGATASAAYGTVTSAVPQGVANKLIKLDISNGSISDWFTRSGSNSSLYGFDFQGNPIIFSNTTYGYVLWLTKSPTNAVVIANFSMPFWPQGQPSGDGKGIWFPAYYNQTWSGWNGQGMLLYVGGSGLYWMASVGGQLAGACA